MGSAEKITLTPAISSTFTEVLDADDVPGAQSETQRTVTHDAWNYTTPLHNTSGSATTPAPVRCFSTTVTLSGASATLDLTAAPTVGNLSAGEDLTGKKLMFCQFYTDADNDSGGVTIGPGASNGYELFGSASAELLMFPDEYAEKLTLGSNLDDVGATDCEIDFAGTSGDKIYVKMAFEA